MQLFCKPLILFLRCGNPFFEYGQQIPGSVLLVPRVLFCRLNTCRERTQVKQFFPHRFHIMPERARLFLHEGKTRLFLCRIAPKDGRFGRNQITMRVP